MSESVAKMYEEMHAMARKLAEDDVKHFEGVSLPRKQTKKDFEYDAYMKHLLTMTEIVSGGTEQ